MLIDHTFKTISSYVIDVGEGNTFLLFILLKGGHLRTVRFDVMKKEK